MTMTRKALWLLGGLVILIGVSAFCLLYTPAGKIYARRGLYAIVCTGMSKSHVDALLGRPGHVFAQPDTFYYWPLPPHLDLHVSPYRMHIVGPVCIVYSNGFVRSKRWLDDQEQEEVRIRGL